MIPKRGAWVQVYAVGGDVAGGRVWKAPESPVVEVGRGLKSENLAVYLLTAGGGSSDKRIAPVFAYRLLGICCTGVMPAVVPPRRRECGRDGGTHGAVPNAWQEAGLETSEVDLRCQ